MLHITFSNYDCTITYQVWVYLSIYLMLHITFSKYNCIIVHKAYYLFTCTCVSINSFHSHSHSHMCVYFLY